MEETVTMKTMKEELKRGSRKHEYIIPDDLRDIEPLKGADTICCATDEIARNHFNYFRRKYLKIQNKPAEDEK